MRYIMAMESLHDSRRVLLALRFVAAMILAALITCAPQQAFANASEIEDASTGGKSSPVQINDKHAEGPANNSAASKTSDSKPETGSPSIKSNSPETTAKVISSGDITEDEAKDGSENAVGADSWSSGQDGVTSSVAPPEESTDRDDAANENPSNTPTNSGDMDAANPTVADDTTAGGAGEHDGHDPAGISVDSNTANENEPDEPSSFIGSHDEDAQSSGNNNNESHEANASSGKPSEADTENGAAGAGVMDNSPSSRESDVEPGKAQKAVNEGGYAEKDDAPVFAKTSNYESVSRLDQNATVSEKHSSSQQLKHPCDSIPVVEHDRKTVEVTAASDEAQTLQSWVSSAPVEQIGVSANLSSAEEPSPESADVINSPGECDVASSSSKLKQLGFMGMNLPAGIPWIPSETKISTRCSNASFAEYEALSPDQNLGFALKRAVFIFSDDDWQTLPCMRGLIRCRSPSLA